MATRNRPRAPKSRKKQPRVEDGGRVDVLPAPPGRSAAPVSAVLAAGRDDDEDPRQLARAVALLGDTSRHGAISALRKEFEICYTDADALITRAEQVVLPQQPGIMDAYRANVLAQLDRIYVLGIMQGDLRAAVAAVDRKSRLLGLDIVPSKNPTYGAGSTARRAAMLTSGSGAGEPLSIEELSELREFVAANPALALPEVS